MSRILIAWELGLNLGHLARLMPLAARLKARGHAVLAAVRDIPAAATVFGPANITFVPAPCLPQGLKLPHRATGYADILLSQGWGDPAALWGLAHAWLNLMRMFRPDLVLLDYSPTARLAARIAGIPAALVGNGFELPPAANPLPAFPGFSWASAEKAAQSEATALAHARTVTHAFGAPPLAALQELFDGKFRLLATFPELDHYGPRPQSRYLGPLLGDLQRERIDWPQAPGKRIFACLRPDTEHADAILAALAQSRAAVVCFAPGFSRERLRPHGRPHLRIATRPVDLKPLAASADLCVSYGAEGTVATFLLAGVPQLLAPRHVEAHMAARRIEALGAAMVLRGAQTAEGVGTAMAQLTRQPDHKRRAAAFAEEHKGFDPATAADEAVGLLETAAGGRKPHDNPPFNERLAALNA